MSETITKNIIVVFETNKGNFEVQLDQKNSPITTKNFLDYVNEGFYDGLIFHRVIKGFMIQGGGFDINMKQKKTKEPIKNEANNGLKNLKYTIAMARTSEINSATSQFFINTANNSFLDYGVRDYGYAVFGKVINGFETIDKIENSKTQAVSYFDDVPIEPVIINKVYVKK
ncbi:MAG: peptidylprolyl isomerase [Candidatus Woesearchaeota archaeon]